MSNQRDASGNLIDNHGVIYTTNSGQPPIGGERVQIPDGRGGSTFGTWSGGSVTHDKKD